MMPEYENSCVDEYMNITKDNLPFNLQKSSQIKANYDH